MNSILRRTQRPFLFTLLLLILTILLAYWLRLINLDAFSFWTDEGLTPLRSGYPLTEILSNRIIIQEGITKDTHPAFYYLIIHVTRQLFGVTDFAFRYPSLLAGVLLVPLMYQFGRRLRVVARSGDRPHANTETNQRTKLQNRFGTDVGLLAALLVAVNPLQVYYANEARMYTVLVLLAAAASYVLWRALQGGDLRQYLPAYILLAGLAFYTHYTAVFLIAAQAVFWVWLLWRQGYKKVLIGTAVVALLLAIPVIPFTIPRLFTGAEANYYYVAPFVMLKDVVHFFNLGMSTDFNQWNIKLLDSLLLVLGLIGLWAAQSWLKRSFLLTYLLAVVFGLMMGSLLKPMYQGVRHIMLGSPAFVLLLALGMGTLIRYLLPQSANHPRAEPEPKHLARRVMMSFVGIILLLAPFVGAYLSLGNLYNNPAYAKGDFRSIIHYIEERAGENDVIVYNDAILLPTHAQYKTRQDIDVTALPVYPHAADTNLEAQLAALAAQYDRIWFMPGKPADGRDAERQVRGWLDAHLSVVDERRFSTQNANVSTVAFSTAVQTTETVAENGRSLAITWPELPSLVGIQTNFTEPATATALWFDLFWAGDQAPPDAASLRFSLRDPDGQEWVVNEQGLARATAVWPADGFVRQSYKLPVPLGTPPGNYALWAQPLVDGSVLAEPQMLTEIEMGVMQSPISSNPAIIFDNGLSLQAVELYDEGVFPGNNLPIDLYWKIQNGVEINTSGLHYRLALIGPDGEPLRDQTAAPGAAWLEVWPQDVVLRESTGVFIYPETQPGKYQLQWRLETDDGVVAGRPFWRPWSSETITYGSIEVLPWPLESTLPDNVDLVDAQFGSAIQLYGYNLGTVDAGNLPLTLVWQANDVPADSYLVFVHLVDAVGNIVSQVDRVPVDGLRPTSGWRAGEVLTDNIVLTLPADLVSGTYTVNVGIFNTDDGQRLPLLVNRQPQTNNQLSLATVTLP
ncbi:MAG: glycosyltransferase family 39 protein [Anaerolineales bacterium]|nr:glycosyltransferase family 39 protein [Anaerolineales bacterium]